MRESWKNVFGVLESPGNFFDQKSGNPDIDVLPNLYLLFILVFNK